MFVEILVYEVGHYLGLFYLMEVDGKMYDFFEDIFECVFVRDTNKDGFVDSAECKGYGMDYVMFWMLDAVVQIKISSN